eukprot:467248-Prorocentrum_minimum.AAC.1
MESCPFTGAKSCASISAVTIPRHSYARSNASFSTVDCCRTTTLKWSSCPTRTAHPLSADTYTPRPVGQSLAMPALSSSGYLSGYDAGFSSISPSATS